MATSTSNTGKPWSDGEVRTLRKLARANTPTRVIGLKLGFGLFAAAWAVLTALHGAAFNWQMLAGVRGLMGFAEGTAQPGGMKAVAEGVKTTRAARDLGRKVGVDLPITEAIYTILYEGRPPREAVAELMGRELRPERD